MEETIARLVQGFIAFGLAYTIALWFALVLWTWRDIASRSTNPAVQVLATLVVLLFFAPGAVIYLMLRPRETLDEAYQRSVADEYLVQDLEAYQTCPSCRRPTRDEFVFCPHCRTELRHECAECGKLVDLRWEVCAFCGKPGHGRLSVPSAFDRAHWEPSTLDSVVTSDRDLAPTIPAAAATYDLEGATTRTLNTGAPQPNGSQPDRVIEPQPVTTDRARDQGSERRQDESDN